MHAGRKRRLIIALFIVLLILAVAYGVAGKIIGDRYMKYEINIPSGFTVTAHAGSMGTEENTVASLLTAAKYADVLEMDVCFDKDGVPVLSHEVPPPEGCAKLEDALQALASLPGKKANLDLKAVDDLAQIERLAVRAGVADRVFFTGVHDDFLPAVKKAGLSIPYYLNCSVPEEKANDEEYLLSLAKKVKDSGAVGINLHHSGVSALMAEVFHANGLLVSVWTVNDAEDMCRILSYGVDNITSREPRTLGLMAARRPLY